MVVVFFVLMWRRGIPQISHDDHLRALRAREKFEVFPDEVLVLAHVLAQISTVLI